jgi:hypothetical protein
MDISAIVSPLVYFFRINLFLKIKKLVLKVKQIIIVNCRYYKDLLKGECGMVLRDSYNRQYLDLKNKLLQIKASFAYAASKAKRANKIELILDLVDRTAKELDARYFDEMTLDQIEQSVDALNKDIVKSK